MMKEYYLENEYAKFWVENGIVLSIYKPQLITINIDVAKKLVSDRLKILNDTTRPIFIDTCNLKTIEKEARDYLAQGEAIKYLSATAILIHNRIAKLGANFYISLSRPKIPTKIFMEKAKALDWLEKYKLPNLN